jgi:hypothetical protein
MSTRVGTQLQTKLCEHQRMDHDGMQRALQTPNLLPLTDKLLSRSTPGAVSMFSRCTWTHEHSLAPTTTHMYVTHVVAYGCNQHGSRPTLKPLGA